MDPRPTSFKRKERAKGPWPLKMPSIVCSEYIAYCVVLEQEKPCNDNIFASIWIIKTIALYDAIASDKDSFIQLFMKLKPWKHQSLKRYYVAHITKNIHDMKMGGWGSTNAPNEVSNFFFDLMLPLIKCLDFIKIHVKSKMNLCLIFTHLYHNTLVE